MKANGFTLIELLIFCAIGGIGLAVLFGSPIQTKLSCMNSGGTWTEGIQYGRITQFCTYN